MKRTIITVLLLLLSVAIFAQNANWDKPKLSGSSRDAIDLNYVFHKNDVHTYAVSTESVTSIDIAGKKQVVPVTMNIEGKYTVKDAKNDGTAVIESVITRIYGNMKSGFMELEFDTEKPDAMNLPGVGDFALLVNTPVVTTVNAKGKVISTDTTAFDAKIQNSQMGAQSLKQILDDSINQTFIILPEGKVKKGDVYSGGIIVKTMEGMGELKSEMKYEILDISADKKQVLLKPLGKITMANVKIKDTRINGWLLFLVDKGIMQKSSVDMFMAMEVSMPDNGMTFNMEMNTAVKYLLK